jgi:uncharacterized protein
MFIRWSKQHFDGFHWQEKPTPEIGKLSESIPQVTSDYVLDESYTIIRIRAGHAIAVQFGEALRASRLLHMEHVTAETIEAAWRIFKDFSDHEFRFTDCTSFVVMERLGIEAAFTFDANFREYEHFLVNP